MVVSNKLESLIRFTGQRLREHQVAHIFKVPEELQQTPVDFFGYTASGRAILIEAKMVNRASLPIGCSNGLQPHQWNELLDANRANCIALLAWMRKDIVSVVDVDQVIAYSKGRKSIPWGAIPSYCHREPRPTACLKLFDRWLPLPSATGTTG